MRLSPLQRPDVRMDTANGTLSDFASGFCWKRAGSRKEVARDVKQNGTPFVRPRRIVKSLDGNLDDLFTRVHFDPDLSVAEIDLVAPTILATDYRMGHFGSSIFQWVNPAVLDWTQTFVLPWRDIVIVLPQSRSEVQTTRPII